MVATSQDNTPNNTTGFLNNTSDRDGDISAVFVCISGVLKQVDLAESFYTTINGKNLATKKSDIVTALEAIS